MRRLILWDVDHALIETRGVGSEVFRDAFRAATGHALADAAQVQGALEHALFAASCRANGVPGDPADLFPAFAEIQAGLYRERAGLLREQGRVLPGVRDALEALAGRDGIVSSVLTGNTQASGRAKLEAFGLTGLLDLDAAAWAEDADERAGLPTVAWDRAQAEHNVRFGPSNTIVVGDSPADVTAARANGIRCIGVATGKANAWELADAGAYRTFENLSDTIGVLEWLLG